MLTTHKITLSSHCLLTVAELRPLTTNSPPHSSDHNRHICLGKSNELTHPWHNKLPMQLARSSSFITSQYEYLKPPLPMHNATPFKLHRRHPCLSTCKTQLHKRHNSFHGMLISHTPTPLFSYYFPSLYLLFHFILFWRNVNT